ncbi:MAG: hypothetical protein JRN46_02340 [Nitrososphaerota archaeon]|nr:hypothetical protein [Nitrososphaerota archaeon]
MSFDPEVYRQLKRVAEDATELAASRSEVVNAILSSFFAEGRTDERVSHLLKHERRAARARVVSRS